MAAVGLHHGHHLFGAADRGLVLESVSASGQMNAKTKVAAMVAAGTLALASPALMNFLGKWEGEGQNTVYPDRLADNLPTVCKGITKHTSPYPVVMGDYCSDARCAAVDKMVVTTRSEERRVGEEGVSTRQYRGN